MNAKRFTAIALKWRDKINGNTYHSVRVIRHRDGAVLCCPFQYGYGNQYEWTAIEAMQQAKWIEPDTDHRWHSFDVRIIIWTCSHATKRECVAHGKATYHVKEDNRRKSCPR